MTARDLITGSLRLIGAISTGETPSANELSDGLSVFNDMIDSWSADGFLINEIKRETFALISSQQTYTIGVSGDFNTARPSQILEVSIEQNGVEIPVKIVNTQEWSRISYKTTRSTIPQKMYIEGSFPLERINLWPIPIAANSLILYSLKPLTRITSLNDDISYPPSYAKAFRYNLALELAPEYGKEPSALVLSAAIESKASIARSNTQPVYMTSDAEGLSTKKSFNWITGV